MLIEPPAGFFDPEYLERLRRHFELPDQNRDENCMSNPTILVERMEACKLDPKKAKFCDLGSGTGYLLAALGVHGCPAYGVEFRPANVTFALERFAQIPSTVVPQIMHGNYLEDSIWNKRFNDGTNLKEIDFFYCNPYDRKHALQILACLAGKDRAKEGAVIFEYEAYMLDDQNLSEIGFEILPTRYTDTPCYVKAASLELTNAGREDFCRFQLAADSARLKTYRARKPSPKVF